MSARLDELDRTELGDLARRLRPDLTDEQVEAMWQRFIELKRLKGMQ